MGDKNPFVGELVFFDGEKILPGIGWETIAERIEEDKGLDDDDKIYIRFDGYVLKMLPGELTELGIDTMEKFRNYCEAIVFAIVSKKLESVLKEEKNFLEDKEYAEILIYEVGKYLDENKNKHVDVDVPTKRNKIYKWG